MPSPCANALLMLGRPWTPSVCPSQPKCEWIISKWIVIAHLSNPYISVTFSLAGLTCLHFEIRTHWLNKYTESLNRLKLHDMTWYIMITRFLTNLKYSVHNRSKNNHFNFCPRTETKMCQSTLSGKAGCLQGLECVEMYSVYSYQESANHICQFFLDGKSKLT